MDKTDELERKARDSDRRLAHYKRRIDKLQGDYHNLIGITADLVETLEATLQGKPVLFLNPLFYFKLYKSEHFYKLELLLQFPAICPEIIIISSRVVV